MRADLLRAPLRSGLQRRGVLQPGLPARYLLLRHLVGRDLRELRDPELLREGRGVPAPLRPAGGRQLLRAAPGRRLREQGVLPGCLRGRLLLLPDPVGRIVRRTGGQGVRCRPVRRRVVRFAAGWLVLRGAHRAVLQQFPMLQRGVQLRAAVLLDGVGCHVRAVRRSPLHVLHGRSSRAPPAGQKGNQFRERGEGLRRAKPPGRPLDPKTFRGAQSAPSVPATPVTPPPATVKPGKPAK